MTTIIRTAPPLAVDDVRESLLGVFRQAKDAIEAGSSVVFAVEAGDLLGHNGPERAAFTGAVVGMARAIAFEGARAGWQANVLAAPPDSAIDDDDVVSCIGPGVTGQVITVGTSLVGKVAP